ncbi:MAG: hypothetical protein NW205_08010 [Hyphomicrobiaceae bacterium]|nr:hypothetical protein [Hyphomicrobiaceae bacterium]
MSLIVCLAIVGALSSDAYAATVHTLHGHGLGALAAGAEGHHHHHHDDAAPHYDHHQPADTNAAEAGSAGLAQSPDDGQCAGASCEDCAYASGSLVALAGQPPRLTVPARTRERRPLYDSAGISAGEARLERPPTLIL